VERPPAAEEILTVLPADEPAEASLPAVAPPRRRRQPGPEYDDDDVPRPQPRRPRFQCPFCGTRSFPVVERRISTAGWVMFIILLVLLCLPLCWLGLLMKDEYRVCSACGMKLGG
jgi:hypothetical protein